MHWGARHHAARAAKVLQSTASQPVVSAARLASVTGGPCLADYDDQPTLRFSADSFPRLAVTS
jgi:hypothetical protein